MEKKILFFILVLLSISAKSQTNTTLVSELLLADTAQKNSPTKYFTNNKNKAFFQYNIFGSKMLYTIKADGSIVLGDLIIDAVIKGLADRGYIISKIDTTIKQKRKK